jgi:dihydrolipoamide dehydrogenase
MSTQDADVVVIGAGPAGEVVAGRLGEAGVTVTLVEEHLVGGECSFYGCMPSKALLRPGELLAEVQRVPGAREAICRGLDPEEVLKRRDEVIHNFDDSGMLPWLDERGITLVRGRGRLTGEREVTAGDVVVRAGKAVVVATGTRATVPPIPGLREAKAWTNHEGTTAKAVPASLLVLGGGPIGAELAQAWRSLGSEVTLIESAPRLLGREEEFASEQVATSLGDQGVDVRTGVKAAAVRREGDGPVTLVLETGEELTADELLVAIGRTPNTDDLGVDILGLEPGKPIEVDDTMRVRGHPWLMAVGDVNGRALLTHVGKYQARVAADVIRGRDVRARDADAPPPRVTFTDPQVAAVGHTLASARDAGLRVHAVEVGTGANAGGSFYGKGAPGTARIVIDEDADVIVGATITGTEIADFLQAATIAVTAHVPMSELWHAVPAFPTRSELWLRLIEADGR